MKINNFILLCLIFTVIIFSGCSGKKDNKSSSYLNSSIDESSNVISQSSVQNSSSFNSNQMLENKENSYSRADKRSLTSTLENDDIVAKVKNYILNGQSDKPAAEKLNWNEVFLDNVNIKSVYNKYISSGGKADNIKSFSEYLTQNAPIQNNWKKLFEKYMLKTYGEKVIRYTHLQDNLYQVYVKKEENEVPYVVVNARTGYFHG